MFLIVVSIDFSGRCWGVGVVQMWMIPLLQFPAIQAHASDFESNGGKSVFTFWTKVFLHFEDMDQSRYWAVSVLNWTTSAESRHLTLCGNWSQRLQKKREFFPPTWTNLLCVCSVSSAPEHWEAQSNIWSCSQVQWIEFCEKVESDEWVWWIFKETCNYALVIKPSLHNRVLIPDIRACHFGCF